MFQRTFKVTELARFVESAFTVDSISSDLETCDHTDDAKQVRDRMRHKAYDFMGVWEGKRVVGYVIADDLLEGLCGQYLTRFTPDLLVGANALLVEVLPLLAATPHLFVLERTSINKIVTRADLQKPPMRMLLFSLVMLLESALLSMVRALYPDDSFKSHLSAQRLGKAEQLLQLRVQKDEVIDLADCLQMADKRDLILKRKGFHDFFGWKSKAEADEFFKGAEELRNRLAHMQDIDSGTTWEHVAALTARIDRFLREFEFRAGEIEQEFSARLND